MDQNVDQEAKMFEDKNVPMSNDRKKLNKTLEFANKVYPDHIPLFLHRMTSLSDIKTHKGKCWGLATEYLLDNKAHGFSLWKQLQEQMRSGDAKDSCQPHVSTKMAGFIKNKFFVVQGDFALLTEALLVQLPFQPVLLYMWLTETLKSMLAFECKFEKFYAFPIPAKWKPELLRLSKMVSTTYRHMGFLFDYLQHQVESENEIFVGNLKAFELILQKVLDFHNFIANRGCEVLANLSSRCWAKWDIVWRGELFQLRREVIPFKKRNFLFNPDVWTHGPNKMLQLFGSSNEQIVTKELDLPNDPGIEDKIFKHILEKFLDFPSMAKLNKAGIARSENAAFVKGVNEVREVYLREDNMHLVYSDEVLKGSVGDILEGVLQNDHLRGFSNVVAQVVRVYGLSPLNADPLKEDCYDSMDDNEISALISNLDLDNYPFSFKQTLVTLKKRFGLFYNSTSTVPTTDYEARIRKIVLSCIEGHLEMQNSKEKDQVLRDWQVAQFLLPCFAALHLELCESKKPEDEPVKLWFGKFLNELIKTYEGAEGVRKSSWSNIINDINQNPELHTSYYNDNHESLLSFFKKVSNDFLSNIKGSQSAFSQFKFCGYFKAFYEVLENICQADEERHSQKDDTCIATKACVYWNWLMWDFFRRMNEAIQESSPRST